ncbi:MAG: LPS export ABC transporter permease LptG [Gemmatimonadota bacterium]
MRTLRRYLTREVAQATGFVLFALLALFAFFDLIAQLNEISSTYQLRTAFAYVTLSLPSRTYELMPIAALIGTIYALSKLASNSEFTIMRVSGMSTRRLAGTLIRIALVFIALTYLFGELVAPPAERVAQQLKLAAKGDSVEEFRSGVWVRDAVKGNDGKIERWRFVNVRQVRPDGTLRSMRVFEFDRDYRLRAIGTAASGRFIVDSKGPAWQLNDVVATLLPVVSPSDTAQSDQRTEIVRAGTLRWASELTPDIFNVLLVQPERMAAIDLAQYIRHLSANRQQTDRYEIALWNKVFYPLAILVMMMLALPFAYLHVRQGSVSLKIFTGVMIGVIFYMMNKLFAHLGLLNTWPPVVVAALPSLVVLGVALGTLYWLERR